MIRNVIAVPASATVMEACEFFVLHKFFAFPLVDENRRVIGLVDVGLFTEEVFDIAEREQLTEVFETLGFHVAQVRDASPFHAFRVRVPWLLATIVSGTFCAFLSKFYELTLAKRLVLTFFLTMILGLAESVSMQSMAVTIQLLRTNKPSLGWYLRTLRRESTTSLLLGAACGLAVALIVCVWRGAGLPAVVIGSSVLFSAFVANLAGLSVPTLLHARKLDPKIAAGPITLAVADILTLLFYFSLARFLL
jgi:magnesium transporter